MSAIDSLIQKNRILVFVGSGGVGKTTLAAAIALQSAKLGYRTLVLTMDPSKRLATTLGIQSQGTEPQPVPNCQWPLSSVWLDARAIFDEFIRTQAKDSAIAQRVLQNRLYQQLATTLSGSQEFTSLEKLLQLWESNQFDRIILDTPPSKHAIDFLTAPEKIRALFEESVTRWFFSPPSGIIASLVSRGTKTMLKSLEVLTGGDFLRELADFFESIRTLQASIQDRTRKVETVLKSEQTAFVLISSFDLAKLQEAEVLADKLREIQCHLRGVIINRAFPAWARNSNEPIGKSSQVSEVLFSFYQQFYSFHTERYQQYNEFAERMRKTAKVFRIPEFNRDLSGLEDLAKIPNEVVGESYE